MQPLIKLFGLTKAYGAAVAVHPLDLEVAYGDFCAILGPSGCGKSTLLRMIAGFVEPSAGTIMIDGVDVTATGPETRPTNMVFQGYGLFPHLSVAENVGFGLALRKVAPDAMRHQVNEALRLVHLEGFGERGIDRLSGGQQQRVALARALIMRPKVLLLDEPLAALDLKLRHAMQEELRRIHHEIGGTFIFVTHDQMEAFALASRIVVMNEGRIEQVGDPQEIYGKPSSLFVADFVGETNVLRGMRKAGSVILEAGAGFSAQGPDAPIRLVVRPESVRRGEGGPVSVKGQITDLVFLGNALKVVATLSSGEEITIRDPDIHNIDSYTVGATESFAWALNHQRILENAP
jgi:ABC-type Fe3+/spermidine/putrescine transport system ATPase subunit